MRVAFLPSKPLYVFLLLLVFVPDLVSAVDFGGKTITAVSFEPTVQPIDKRDLDRLQLVRIGEALDPRNVAATIDRLFSTGLYDDIQVDAEASAGGVSIQFVTVPRRFIGHVGAEGDIKSPPGRSVIISDAQLLLGTPFDQESLETARRSIEQELRQNGLYGATVGVATAEDPETYQMTVRFLVDSGKRAKYEMPEIKGDTKLPDQTIVAATGWRIKFIHRWRQVTQSLTDKGLDGIDKKYSKQERLTASVNLTSIDYDADTNRAKAHLDIDAGPKVSLRALEAKVSKGKLREYVPVYEEGSVDNDLLTEGATNLRDYFQARGYPDADVTFRREPVQNDQEVINFYIATGPRRKLANVAIKGNTYFLDDTLRERMFLRSSSLALRYGRYSESFRKKDEQSIENLYQSNGFRDVKVTSQVETNYKGKEKDIAVTFQVNEGSQWRVATLKIEGTSRLDLKSINDQFASISGQPFAEVNVATDRNRILQFYNAHGFLAATFAYQVLPGAEPKTVDLIYRVSEGPQEFVRQVILSGLSRTKPALVKSFIDVEDGEPVSLTKVNDVSKKLSGLGVFANVNSALQDPDGSNRYKYVLYDFDEAARYTFNVGFGLEVGQFGGTTNNLSESGGAKGVSPIVSFDVNRLNFLGIGQTVSLQTRYSTLEQRYSLNYIVPRFLGSQKRTVTFSLLYDTTQDVQTFSSQREEASVQTSQRFNRASTLLLRFAYGA